MFQQTGAHLKITSSERASKVHYHHQQRNLVTAAAAAPVAIVFSFSNKNKVTISVAQTRNLPPCNLWSIFLDSRGHIMHRLPLAEEQTSGRSFLRNAKNVVSPYSKGGGQFYNTLHHTQHTNCATELN